MIVVKRLKDYFANSTIHGLRYLTEEGRHFIERIFWLAAVCASTAGMYILAAEAWDAFVNHPASFVTDTNYLKWNTSFPAVTVCQRMDGNDKIMDFMKENDIDMAKLLYLTTVLDIPDYCVVCDACKVDNETKGHCPEVDDKMLTETRTPCEDLFGKCLWNDKPFDCCAHFLPLMTEMGPCYSINSLLTRSSHSNPNTIDLISNMKTGPGIMNIFITDPINVYLHGPEEVPNRNHPKDMVEFVEYPAMTSSVIFKLVEIENDLGLYDLSVERRGCRFRSEPLPNSPYPLYSYTTCIVECRMKKHLELCNCTTAFMTRLDGTPVCTPEQLFCLLENGKALRVLKPPWLEAAPGLDCDCPLGCSELEMTKIWSSLNDNPDPDSNIEIIIKMASLPSERFQRNVVRTKLDLVVSLGGTAGLFLGASLLSGVEFLIYLLVRSCTHRHEPSTGTQQPAEQNIPIC